MIFTQIKDDIRFRLVKNADKDWSCRVSLEPGKPTLVGATQDDETAVFLVVTPNIMK